MRMCSSRVTLASAALLAAGWAGEAAAFGGFMPSSGGFIGHCVVQAYVIGGPGEANIYLMPQTNVSIPAGGRFWAQQNIYNAPRGITVADLQSCGMTNVTNLRQTGASPAATYATDGYMGFSFTATDPQDGLDYDYEFALSGATNTVFIATKVRHIAPAGPGSAQVIAKLQQSRSTALLQNQPDLLGLLDPAQPSVTMGATDALGAMTSGMRYGPVWGRISASWSSEGGADSRYVLGALGAQTRLSDNAVAGVMLQFDRIKLTDTPTVAEGRGWLAGPYLVARLPDHEMTFEGRALWGKTSNDISPLGTYTDSVDGTRSLVMVKVSTRVDMGGLVLRPRISAAEVHEATDAYTDGGGAAVPKVTTTLDQVLAGVEAQKTVTTAQGTLTLIGALDGVWSRTKSSVNGSSEGTRGRLSLGLTYDLGENGMLSVVGFYDGIGKSDYNARGLAASYVLRF